MTPRYAVKSPPPGHAGYVEITEVMHFHPLSVLPVLAFGPLSGLATPFTSHWDDLREKHTWNSVPDNWKNLGYPPADTTIDLHVALKAKNENALIDVLIDVSTPGHPKLGAHLSREEVAELVAPPSDVLELANAWLEHHGVHPSTISTKHGGSWLTVTGVPVSRANKLLGASYQLYQHIGTNDTVLRTLGYGLPTVLVEHVQNVAPTTHFGFPRTPRQEPFTRRGGVTTEQTKVPEEEPVAVLSRRDQYVTPSFLRSFYSTYRYVPLAADRNVLGVAGYLDDYPSPFDLSQFMNRYRYDATSATYNVVKIRGGKYNPSTPTIEGSLNIQYTSAIAYPTTHIFYSTGGLAARGDGFLNWLDYVLGLWSVPQTVSTPYGMPELGVRGASVLFSSGNDGVGGGSCLSKDSFGNSRVQFLPTFPSTCPWVTSVGGTTGYNPEVAASLSGGGFSVYFPRPLYQHNAVSTFLWNLGGQYNGFYKWFRYPLGDVVFPILLYRQLGIPIVLNNMPKILNGTSCATPTAAGIISLLNDYRISNGRPPLGFLNIWLYGICLGGLNDITSGSNPGCNTDGFSGCAWVTGLGSLDFERLIAILGPVDIS
ncbi:subtilisin-like protein [Lactarius vividus]|nr:subtilisin-like protein [Lactarius vividus]